MCAVYVQVDNVRKQSNDRVTKLTEELHALELVSMFGCLLSVLCTLLVSVCKGSEHSPSRVCDETVICSLAVT